MTPMALAIGVTLVFAVPSFLLLEPRAVAESVGRVAALVGACGLAVVLVGFWNAATALAGARRTVARWSMQASRVGSEGDSSQGVDVMRTSAPAPPLTAAGIFQNSIWLSGAAEFVLTERELQTALRHEFVHVRRKDNLRKLLLRMVSFPGLAGLDKAWREATEMAADDAAVSNASEALDLAAAVIKLSRIAPREFPGELTTALVHSPAESVNARVERLVGWTEPRRNVAGGFSWSYWVCGAIALGSLVLTYADLLQRVHVATEWLVR
jgi:hypothetical protein